MDGHLEEIIIGALLHDVGKVCQRADENPQQMSHERFGERWYESLVADVKKALGDVKPFIAHHHTESISSQLRADLYLVWEADNLSAGERAKGSAKNLEFKFYRPLHAVFVNISLKKLVDINPKAYDAFILSECKIEDFFPRTPKDIDREIYKKIIESFTDKLNNTLVVRNKINFLLNLFEEYFSFIPSETAYDPNNPNVLPDISLYDHSRMTAALASCLYIYFKEKYGKKPGEVSRNDLLKRDEQRYLLVMGDISGIQDFIYNVTYKAALKGLRGRSFFVAFLCEHYVRTVLQEIGLSRANVIYIGGGSFILLLPNTERVKNVIKERTERLNKWLFDNFYEKLYLVVSYVEISGNDVAGRGSLLERWRELSEINYDRKNQKFSNMIQSSLFSPMKEKLLYCTVCYKPCSEGEVEEWEDDHICRYCKDLIEVGRLIPRASFIVGDSSNPDFQIETQGYRLIDTDRFPEASEIVYCMNRRLWDAIPLWIAQFPRESVEFSELAKEAVGAKYLAALRMDVDNLGKIFSVGLPNRLRSLSRVATLSRLLGLFFSSLITEIAKGRIPKDVSFNPFGRRERHLVVVYSGGDDLFVVGAWSDVVEFAIEVRRCFQKYTGDNPDITLSGGLVLFHEKTPIYRIAQEAGEAEEEAKRNKAPGHEKYSLNAFGTVMFWDEWEKGIEESLLPLLEIGERRQNQFEPGFSRALIYKLLRLAELARRMKKDGRDLWVAPRILYVLGRSRPRAHEDIWEGRFLKHAVNKDPTETLRWLERSKGPLCWLDYLIRGG